MELQTKVPLKPSTFQIDYSSKLLLLGSCFAEHIGNKFTYYKLQAVTNPFGILFHPKAITQLVQNAVLEEKYTKKDIFNQNERWHSFNAHSVLSTTSQQELLQNLNSAVTETKSTLDTATHLVITLGTAWVYKHLELNKVVANCHKVPQKAFKKQLLTVTEIEASLQELIALVKSVNANAKFIFTVSPVRHIKDGFVENQRSKSHLLTAIHNVIESKENEADAFYFPSYEIMMDELRDYRFYKNDMVHPSGLAVDYIWEKFRNVWLTKKALETTEKVGAVQRGLEHRPFNSESDEHQKFLKSIQEKIAYLQKEHPFISF
ncbi:GSCFA domain-containing protein [Cellulophaga sp. 20_2_10]|uniref:GSCFA domain-containing protein n=1 Tax=Cellulophaga sp. 20_2_10 TaxID=2942476 RepID=UPI00201AE0D5|nr:GSCFA domain-containing protein [Cellulophaga sp. 20_2_10]MCL5246870.1 GSCFA domain-containing protein [Cellulophaga sp. 20_2_10]